MDKVNEQLRVGEKVIVTAKAHAGALIVPVIVLAIGIAGLALKDVVPAGWFRILSIIVSGLGLWKTLNALSHLISTRLTITDQRIFGESGLIPHKTMTLALNDLDAVDSKRDLFGGILGYGTVVVNAAGKGNLRVEYRQIVNAADVAKTMRAQMALPRVMPTAERNGR
ncbi:MAG: PH domain-containing protein [Anaerolineae bacterium]